jgi:membrane protein
MNRSTDHQHWHHFGVIREVINATYASWREDRTLRLGAGLAYYALFTVVPFLALTAALAEQIFGLVDVAGYLADRLEQLGIVDAGDAGESIATELSRQSVSSSLGIIGVGSLLFASSLVFLALVDAINSIWAVPVRSGIGNSVRRRLISFLMVLVTGVVVIAALAVSAVSGAVERLVPGSFEIAGTVSDLIGWAASASTLAVGLTLLFRYVGPVRAPWLSTALSAIATSFLMVIGAQAITWYLTTFGGSSLSGAFGAVLLMLSWVYYEAQILLGGVQLVKVLSARQGLLIDSDSVLSEH